MQGSGARGWFLETLCCFHLPFLASESFHGGYLAQPDRCPPNKSSHFPTPGSRCPVLRASCSHHPPQGPKPRGCCGAGLFPPAGAVCFLLQEAPANGQMGQVSAGTSCQAGYAASLLKPEGPSDGTWALQLLPSCALHPLRPDLKQGAGVRFIHVKWTSGAGHSRRDGLKPRVSSLSEPN